MGEGAATWGRPQKTAKDLKKTHFAEPGQSLYQHVPGPERPRGFSIWRQLRRGGSRGRNLRPAGAVTKPDRLVRPQGKGQSARLQALKDRHHRARHSDPGSGRIWPHPGLRQLAGLPRRRRRRPHRRAPGTEQMVGELDPLSRHLRRPAQRAAPVRRQGRPLCRTAAGRGAAAARRADQRPSDGRARQMVPGA